MWKSSYFGPGAACPVSCGGLAARGFARARRGFVTYAAGQRLLLRHIAKGGLLVQHGYQGRARSGVITRTLCQVTDGPVGAAVEMVITTHSLWGSSKESVWGSLVQKSPQFI